MAKSRVACLILMGLLLMLFLPKYSTAQLRSMCLAQFSLANQACSVLPAIEGPETLNQTKLEADTGNADGNDNDDDDGEHQPRHNNGTSHRQRFNHGHSPTPSPEHGHGHGHKQRHEHEQRHDHGSGHGDPQKEDSRASRDCCRWLREVDESCVCTVLLRLPAFLVKPKHRYSIKVGDTCSRTYDCNWD